MQILAYAFAIVLALVISYGVFILSTKLHYDFSYEEKVNKTINERVKEECLK